MPLKEPAPRISGVIRKSSTKTKSGKRKLEEVVKTVNDMATRTDPGEVETISASVVLRGDVHNVISGKGITGACACHMLGSSPFVFLVNR